MTRHIVTEEDFENRLEQVRKYVHDSALTNPESGVFGPFSETWKRAGDSIGFLASAKIFMMQESHPVIGKALNDHTTVEEDPLGRWKTSFEYVNALTFADLDTAFAKARQLWKIHSFIVGDLLDGTPYAANEEDALLWVAANMFQAMDEMHDMAYGTRDIRLKRKHYREFKLFAMMFGVSDDTLPPEYEDYKRYYQGTIDSGILRIEPKTKDRYWFFTNKFLTGSLRELRPLATKYVSFTSGLLPETVREQYGMPWELKDIATFLGTKALIRTTYPRLPKAARESLYYKQYVKGLYK